MRGNDELIRKYYQAVASGRITRRDFIQGMAVAAGALFMPGSHGPGPISSLPGNGSSCGNRGSRSGFPGPNGNPDSVVSACHTVRPEGREIPAGTAFAESDPVDYDLIIVGGGLSGLAASYYYAKLAGADKRVLILDNHTQVGGVARRNHMEVEGSTLIAPQGSYYAGAPEFPFIADMYDDIGLDLDAIEVPPSPGAILFDEVSHGVPHQWILNPYGSGMLHFPLSVTARRQIIAFGERLDMFYEQPDWKTELGRLDGMTLQEHIEGDLAYDPEVTRFYENNCLDAQGLGADAISAAGYYWFNAGAGSGSRGRGRAVGRRADSTGAYVFPGGNEGFARYILRAVIPDAVPYGPSMKDVIFNRILTQYLDLPDNVVRLRLGATAVDVVHVTRRDRLQRVRVRYLKDGDYHTVYGRGAILAGGGFMTRNIVSDLPEKNQSAYEEFSYSAYLLCNIFVNNSRAAADVGFGWYALYYDGFGTSLTLETGINDRVGNDPSRPNCYSIWAPLNYPGLSYEEQGIAGRQYLLSTTFEEIEERCLDDMVRLLGPHGFDPAVDIEAVYINRWGHALVTTWPGFAFGRLNGIEDPPSRARKPYGLIAFAHTDLEGSPHMDAAFSQAHRAVIEIMGR